MHSGVNQAKKSPHSVGSDGQAYLEGELLAALKGGMVLVNHVPLSQTAVLEVSAQVDMQLLVDLALDGSRDRLSALDAAQRAGRDTKAQGEGFLGDTLLQAQLPELLSRHERLFVPPAGFRSGQHIHAGIDRHAFHLEFGRLGLLEVNLQTLTLCRPDLHALDLAEPLDFALGDDRGIDVHAVALVADDQQLAGRHGFTFFCRLRNRLEKSMIFTI